ncbi:MAG: glycosyltransferase family 2 protein [Bacteroidia bacterium]
MTVSLVIATYNWPEALELIIFSALNQRIPPLEIIIADDGSTPETTTLINKISNNSAVPIHHIWQPDDGFQKSIILNKAFAKSTGEYIIQIDGDVILHRNFIEDHVQLAQKNCFIQGGRVILGKAISERILLKKQTKISILKGGIKRREEGIRMILLSNFLSTRYRNKYPVYYARGANMSFWKSDLLETNGYNEEFSGWGHEDSELTVRLLNAGKRKLILKFGGIVYHLFHHEHHSKKNDARNEKLLKQTVASGLVYVDKGIDQYVK